MERISTSKPSFYKFLTSAEECTSMFEIPPEFVKKYGENLPPNVTLRIDESGKNSWKVRIEKIGQKYFFTDGWNKFAEEVDVSFQEYLIFKFLGLSDASENDPTQCKNKFCSEEPMGKGKGEDEDKWTNKSDDGCGNNAGRRWRFTKKLEQNDTNRLEIPKDIAVDSGVAMNRGIILQDAKGRTWPVHVTEGKCGWFVLTLGWYDFVAGNNAVVGNTVLLDFTSNSDYVMALVLKDGINGKDTFSFVKRECGNPKILDSYEKGDDIGEDRDSRIQRDCECFTSDKRWTFTKKLTEHCRRRLLIPKKFAVGTGIAKSKRIVLLDADGNKWPVRVTDRNCGKFALSSGWNAFLKGNNLGVGAMVSFEFISTSENIVKARLLEQSSSEENHLGSSLSSKKPGWFSLATKRNRATGLQKYVESEEEGVVDDSIGSGDGRMWRFHKKLKKHHGMNGKDIFNAVEILDSHEKVDNIGKQTDFSEKIQRDDQHFTNGAHGKRWTFTKKLTAPQAYKTIIPKEFAVGTGIAKSKSIVLLDADGNRWPIHVIVRKCGDFTMSCGWNAFLKGNNISVGAVMSFEFVSTTENLLEARVLERNSSTKHQSDSSEKGGKPRLFSSIRKRNLVPRHQKYVESSKEENYMAGGEDIGKNGDMDEEIQRDEAYGKRWTFTKKLKKSEAYRMHIPKKFASGTGIVRAGRAVLLDADGNKWPVGVMSNSCGDIAISRGWNAFLIGNNVAVGDMVSFEFISSSKNLIEAHVLERSSSEEGQPDFSVERGKPLFSSLKGHQKDTESDGRMWRFKKELKKHDMHKMHIPKKFAKGIGITKEGRIVLKDADGNKWPVYVTDHNCGEFTMGYGWNAFLKANKLSAGTMVSLEFVSTSKNSVEVRVTERSSSEEDQIGPSLKRGKPPKTKADHQSEHQKDLESEDEDDTVKDGKVWRFNKELKKHDAYFLWFPKDFVMSTGIASKTIISLRDVKRRMWPVHLKAPKKSKKCSRLALTAGWNEFLVENKATVGSTVSFKFVPCHRNVIEARIIGNRNEGRELIQSKRKRARLPRQHL